jgi:hypothetical protein
VGAKWDTVNIDASVDGRLLGIPLYHWRHSVQAVVDGKSIIGYLNQLDELSSTSFFATDRGISNDIAVVNGDKEGKVLRSREIEVHLLGFFLYFAHPSIEFAIRPNGKWSVKSNN